MWRKWNAILWRFAAARDLFLHFFFFVFFFLTSSFIASLHVAAPSKPDSFTHTHFCQDSMRYERRSCAIHYASIWLYWFRALCYVCWAHSTVLWRHTANGTHSADMCEPAFSWVLNVGRLVSVFSMFTGYGLWFVNFKLPKGEKKYQFYVKKNRCIFSVNYSSERIFDKGFSNRKNKNSSEILFLNKWREKNHFSIKWSNNSLKQSKVGFYQNKILSPVIIQIQIETHQNILYFLGNSIILRLFSWCGNCGKKISMKNNRWQLQIK